MGNDNNCFFCGIECQIYSPPSNLHHRIKQYECDSCGVYLWDTRPGIYDIDIDKTTKFKIACLLNEKRLKGDGRIALIPNKAKDIKIDGFSAIPIDQLLNEYPKKTKEFINRALWNISYLVKQPFDHIELNLEPIGKYNLFSQEGEQADLFLRELENQGLVSSWGNSNCWEFWSFTLTTKSWEMIESQKELAENNNKEKECKEVKMIKILISHSSKDEKLAEAIINLLIKGLPISPDNIRCTSVDGYRLPGGSRTDEQLKKEVCKCEVLLGIISLYALDSMYVLFELGARWGSGGHLLPLLAPGVSTGILKGPLSAYNALCCDKPAQLHQLIQDLADILGVSSNSPAVYQKEIDSVTAIAPSQKEYLHSNLLLLSETTTDHHNNSSINIKLSNESQKLLLEVAQDKHGYILKTRTSSGTAIETNGKNLIPEQSPRIIAKWEHALDELLNMGFVEERGSKGSSFAITHSGFEHADKLRDKDIK